MSKFAGAGIQSSGGGMNLGRFANFKRKRPSIAQKNLLKETQDAAKRRSNIAMGAIARRSSVFQQIGAQHAGLNQHSSGTGLSNLVIGHKLSAMNEAGFPLSNSKMSGFLQVNTDKQPEAIEEQSSMDDSMGIIDLDQLEKELQELSNREKQRGQNHDGRTSLQGTFGEQQDVSNKNDDIKIKLTSNNFTPPEKHKQNSNKKLINFDGDVHKSQQFIDRKPLAGAPKNVDIKNFLGKHSSRNNVYMDEILENDESPQDLKIKVSDLKLKVYRGEENQSDYQGGHETQQTSIAQLSTLEDRNRYHEERTGQEEIGIKVHKKSTQHSSVVPVTKKSSGPFKSDTYKKSKNEPLPFFQDEFFLVQEDIDFFHERCEEYSSISQEIRLVREQYNRLIVTEYASVFFSCFGIILSIVIYELQQSELFNQEEEFVLLCYSIFSTACLEFTIYLRYDMQLEWFKLRKQLSTYDTLITTGWWQDMLQEQIICLFAPYPFLHQYQYSEENVNWHVTVTYSINSILTCICFIRVYIPLRYLLFSSTFMGPRSSRVTRMAGADATHMFALKAAMKQTPMIYIISTLLASIFLFGYQLKIFEGPLSDVSNQNFNKLSNAMWNVIITLTTTGFGELYPKTMMGRLIGLVICFWGTLMVSIFVVTVNRMLTFSPSEEKSFNLLMRLKFKEELKVHAINVLNSSYRYSQLNKKESQSNSVVSKAFKHFRNKVLTFKTAVRKVKVHYDQETEIEIFQKQLDSLADEVHNIKDVQLHSKSRMDELYGIVEGMHNRIFAPNEQQEKRESVKSQTFYTGRSINSNIRADAVSQRAQMAIQDIQKTPQNRARMTVIQEQNSNNEDEDDEIVIHLKVQDEGEKKEPRRSSITIEYSDFTPDPDKMQ
ncbi:hypothetical protein FGO68_gene975 [Halteria grandinella]|uniref:Potassium channel domain-containing protein n=1 Tax=Halteria grandinella TaxID=5974 RepID=A0A8J8T649_HALGN|nr:hypothetical protein FGO68_gene975 [Halteria grandinella]